MLASTKEDKLLYSDDHLIWCSKVDSGPRTVMPTPQIVIQPYHSKLLANKAHKQPYICFPCIPQQYVLGSVSTLAFYSHVKLQSDSNDLKMIRNSLIYKSVYINSIINHRFFKKMLILFFSCISY